MLPDDFRWTHVLQWSTGPLDCLRLDGAEVARLSQKVGGEWLAMLDQHLPWAVRRSRPCQSYETGMAGIETWAARHEARLRAEVVRRT